MMRALRQFPMSVEACIVLVLCFGMYAASAVLALPTIVRGPQLQPIRFSDGAAMILVCFQVVVLSIVALIGRTRGWSFRDFGLAVSWRLAGVGGILACLVGAAFVGLGFTRVFGFEGSISAPLLFILVVVHPFFEEAIEVGYVTRVMGRFGMWPTVLTSTGIRVFLHVHGGLHGMLGCLVVGILYSCIYWRYRQLLPLIIAHAALVGIVLAPITTW